MRNLAIVISSLGPGGAERVAAMQALWFAQKGFEVALITLEDAAYDHYESEHSNITRVRMRSKGPHALFNYIQNKNFDLTIDHIHWQQEHFEFFDLMAASQQRLVIFDHSTYFYPLYFEKNWPIFEQRAAAYKNATAVSVLSRHACQLIRQSVPATVFIPNPLSYSSDATSAVLRSKNIIAVANWERPEKRLDRILEVFSMVSGEVPESKLILVGPVKPVIIKLLLERYRLRPESIEVVGQQENVEPYYLRSRVLLHASEMEGFGLVLTEAGMHGLPRVAMSSPGLDEVIEQGVDGYLVEQGDKQAAANYLVSLLNDDQLCQQMSTNALNSVRKFELEKIGNRWLWLVDLVTSKSSSDEMEGVITEDCRRQAVDEIGIKRIVLDFDAQFSRLIQLFRQSGYTTGMATGDSGSLHAGASTRVFKSRLAKLLSDVSVELESRLVAKLVRQSGLFDGRWYEKRYPDVKTSRIDPALHYVKFGAAEGRDPSEGFDTNYYLDMHKDIVRNGENPLLHYLHTKDIGASPLESIEGEIAKADTRSKSSRIDADKKWINKFNKNRLLLTLLEPNYLGIRQSASQFTTVEQMLFLNDEMDASSIDHYARLITEARPEKILIQGFPRSYLKLLPLIRASLPNTPIFCIYHGSFAQLSVTEEHRCLQTLIELQREGVLVRLGLVKMGMAETLQSIGVDASFVMNFMKKIPNVPMPDKNMSVGIVGSDWQPLKSLYHQIAACKHFAHEKLKIVGSSHTVAEFCELFEISATHISNLPQSQMPEFLGSNTINLYVTLAECAPMLPLESLAEGVPCLFGPNNHYFFDQAYLRSRLVVDVPDSETRIAHYARQAIEEREQIITEYREYAADYNQRAVKSFEAFLEI